MPKQFKIEHDIDLQCSLCPKNPNFSDISHLLTHISSKSHLANRFKLQIASQTDKNAKDKLEVFEFWYQQSNLDVLLSERLASKDHKKNTKDRKRSSKVSQIKKEKPTELVLQSAKEKTLAGAPNFRAPVPQMHQHPTPAESTGNDDANKLASDSEWEPSAYSTPTARRHIPNFTRAETPVGHQLDPSLAGVSTPWKPATSAEEDADNNKNPGEKLTDSAKLKGVFWPGMNLFDSATPEMKRMRNQKKDGNILEQMIATSRDTEPAEISYHANGEFRASRDIFGPLSTENSPERKPASPVKKKKARKPASALSNLSINAPRLRAPRGKKTAAGKSPTKRPDVMQARPPVFMQPPPTLNPLASGFGQRFVPTAEEDEEFRLTIGDMNKKRTFNVFQDIPEISPGRTETPLEEHRFEDFSSHGLPLFPNNLMSSNHFHVSPTPVPKQTSFRSFGKENTLIESSTAAEARRAPVASHVYPAQVFDDPSSNPLLNYNPYNPYFRAFPYGLNFGDHRSPGGYGQNFMNPMARSMQSGSMQAQAQPIHINHDISENNNGSFSM